MSLEKIPMKAMLLRVGIDTGTDGALAPIFEDGSFEFIPISENDTRSTEKRTYTTTIGRSGKPFSTYLPTKIAERTMHYDPEFATFTYGDPTAKRKYLIKLEKNDLLVFYAGLVPYHTTAQKKGLYIIGYFTVDEVIDFNTITPEEACSAAQRYPNNAHVRRAEDTNDLVIVVGRKAGSRLLEQAIPISQPSLDRRGRPYAAVSNEMKHLLGISGSIQRSIPPRFIQGDDCISNLNRILGI